MSPSRKIQRRSLSEQVTDILRKMILEGEIPSGQRLVEEQLAQKIGTSRTPIREALLRLEREKLLERREKGGFKVRPLSRREVEEVIGVRAALESYALERAARRFRENDLIKLDREVERFAEALKAGDHKELVKRNTAFHEMLYQAADSNHLTRLINEFTDVLYRFRVALLADPEMAARSLSDHRRIMDALKNRDAEAAAVICREHVLRGGHWILAQLNIATGRPSDMAGTEEKRPIRILVSKPGLDGHDRGAKVVAHALRDSGMEVIYSGLHQTVDKIVATALQESVDVIGLSIMSGAHIPICKKLIAALIENKMEDVAVVVGGVIPDKDVAKLQQIGVDGVFPGGTPLPDISRGVSVAVASKREG